MIEATPRPETEDAQDAGGAYVNCWIDFKMQAGAEAVARHYIEDAGWMAGDVEEARTVNKEEYADNPESLAWFTKAEKDGACFVFHTWPVTDGS